MFTKRRTEVLVVGAGPVGLYTALRLAGNGVDVQVMDKDRRTGAHSYALALHARSLRLLDDDGLAGPLIAAGHAVERLRLYRDGDLHLELPLGEDGGDPAVLVLPQSTLERALEDKLAQLRVKVLWNHRLEDLETGPGEVNAEIAKLDRIASGYPIARIEWEVVKSFRMHAGFVVGADGYHSTLRQRMDLDYVSRGPLQHFSVFEFETPEPPGHDLCILYDGEMTSVMWPLADNRCRWSFQVEGPETHESTLDRLNTLIRERAPWCPEASGELHWSSLVQFDRRLASGMGRDRIWLAGDAVHLLGPVGVQSMNAGLVDAYELAGTLTRILRHDASPALFDSYVNERMNELDLLFADPDRITEREPVAPWGTGLGARILGSLPATGRDLDTLLDRLGIDVARVPA